MGDHAATAVIIVHNQKEQLQKCLKVLECAEGIEEIIIVDNGSVDGVAEWLKEQVYGHIIFDEGMQKYGKVINEVVANFEMREFVVFMEPQYLVGKKTAKRMMEIFKENTKTGIVGALSNGFHDLQYLDVKGIEEIYQLEEYVSEKQTSAYLLGFREGFWMIRRQDLLENGSFHELLSCRDNVLMDYELKLLQKGHCHIICKNAYIYDVALGLPMEECGNKEQDADRNILKHIWDMNYFNLTGNRMLVELIEKEKDKKINVLEIGCDLGATLLEIQNYFPNCSAYGMELNPASVNIAKYVANVKVGNIEEDEIPFDEKFDYIIFGDVLEHLRNPQKVIRYCKEKLNKGGSIIASIPNLMHISVMEQLVNGFFPYQDTGLLDKTHIHFFTYYQIVQMFLDEKYLLDDVRQTSTIITDSQKELERELLKLSSNTKEFMYETFQYLIRARKE